VPVVYRCSRCGYILDVFVRVGQNSYGVPTPRELASRYGGICPRCGHRLNTSPDPDRDIVIDMHGVERLVEVLAEARRTMRIRFSTVVSLLPEWARQRLEELLAEEEAAAWQTTAPARQLAEAEA